MGKWEAVEAIERLCWKQEIGNVLKQLERLEICKRKGKRE